MKFYVWCNPTRIGKRGDDYLMEFDTEKEVIEFTQTHKEANKVWFKGQCTNGLVTPQE